MTTTDTFRVSPESFSTIEEAQLQKYKKPINTNPRYPFYCQTNFTAGDEQQFDTYRLKKSFQYLPYVLAPRWDLPLPASIYWDKYLRIETTTIVSTFRYIFHKFKKGIFIQIRDNQVSVMLPFSKHNFRNEWSSRISVDPDLFETIATRSGYTYNPKRIHKDYANWYANNGLVRYEYPISENDTGVSLISHVFKKLCETRTVPDMEFFVNRRDFPLLTKDGTESYNFMFGDNCPLVSHNYDTYAPILSMCVTDKHADVPIPTWDDWGRIFSLQNIFFKKMHTYTPITRSEWALKIPTAIFRGSSTGLGTRIDTNPRLGAASISLQEQCDTDGILLLDAGITSWNHRARKDPHSSQLVTFSKSIIDTIPLVPYMTLQQQTNYKYILNIDGHVTAFRLAMELGSGCCLLLVESEYKIWISDYLKPYVHYVPVKRDLSDLLDRIRWCKEHDNTCRLIAENAYEFWSTYMTEDGMLDYLQSTLVTLKERNERYQYFNKPISEVLYEYQREQLSTFAIVQNEKPTTFSNVQLSTDIRAYDVLEGIRWFITQAPNVNDLLVFEKQLSHTVNSKVSIYKYMDRYFLCKYSDNTKELCHEAFVGLGCINNLCKYIPNFGFTFTRTKNELVTEYIPGSTFYEYLKSNQFCMKEYLWILCQIALTLQDAQYRCLFVHYDLYPWNVVIQRLSKPKVYYYFTGSGYISIRTHIVPVLIDFGKSHIVHNNMHIGYTNSCQFSTINDIMSILLSSMHIIFKTRTLSPNDITVLFSLAKFFDGTEYTQGETFTKIRSLKRFLFHAKKFATMLLPKADMEQKDPMDFITHLKKLQKFPIFSTTHIYKTMRYMSSRYIYQYMCATTPTDRDKAYKDLLERASTAIHTHPSTYTFVYLLHILQDCTPNETIASLEKELFTAHNPDLRIATPDIPSMLPTIHIENMDIFDNPRQLSDAFVNIEHINCDFNIQIVLDYIEYVFAAKAVHVHTTQSEPFSPKTLRYQYLQIANITTIQYMYHHLM